MVISEQPPRDVIALLAPEVQTSVAKFSTPGASLGHGQGIPRAHPGRKNQLCTIPIRDTSKNLSTAGAAPVAPPCASAEAEPSGGLCQLLRCVLPQKPRTNPSDSTGGPPSRDRSTSRCGSDEREFLMPRRSVG